MDRLAFVVELAERAITEVVAGELSALDSPPGRSPSPGLLELSAWYHRLSTDDQRHLMDACALAAHGAVHRILSILDGAVAFGEPGGRLRMLWSTDTRSS